MLDPICYHMWIPTLLINFLYRPLTVVKPKPGHHKHSVAHHLHFPLLEQRGNSTAAASSAMGPLVDWPLPESRVAAQVSSAPASMLTMLWSALLAPTRLAGRAFQSVTSWLGLDVPHPALMLKDLLIMGPAREMHCTAALCRNMDWRSTSLWPHQMHLPPGKCMIVLAGDDELVPSSLVAPWVHSTTAVRVRIAPALRHADVLVAGDVLDPLMADIYDMAYGQ